MPTSKTYKKATTAVKTIVDMKIVWFIGAATFAACAMALGRGNNRNPNNKNHVNVPFGLFVIVLTVLFGVMQIQSSWKLQKCQVKTTFLDYLVNDAKMKVNICILLVILGIYLWVMYEDNVVKMSWDTLFHFGCIACIYCTALHASKDVPCPTGSAPLAPTPAMAYNPADSGVDPIDYTDALMTPT